MKWPILLLASVYVVSLYASDDWDYIVFTQQWPPSICIQQNETHQHTCTIWPNISTWTVHGIWPSQNGTHTGPSYCTNETFDPSQIESLVPQLAEYWPNLYTDTDLYDFWKHEWEKHGTCAENVPTLDGEYKFFNMGLKLNSNFNFLKAIQPSDTPYKYTEFVEAVQKALGANVTITCYHEKHAEYQYIQQIEMCLTKSFDVFNCAQASGSAGCNDTMDIMYPKMPNA